MSKNKKIVTGAVAAIVVLALAGGIWWYIDERPKTPSFSFVSSRGFAYL